MSPNKISYAKVERLKAIRENYRFPEA